MSINTMPEHTLRAFADHGEVARTLDADPDGAERTLAAAAAAGIDLAASPPSSSARASSRSATPITSCSTASRASSACSRRHRSLAVRAVSDRLAARRGPRRCCAFGRARRGGWSPYPRRSRAHSSFSLSARPASSSRQRARNSPNRSGALTRDSNPTRSCPSVNCASASRDGCTSSGWVMSSTDRETSSGLGYPRVRSSDGFTRLK